MQAWLTTPQLNCLEDTGYASWVLVYIWDKYLSFFDMHKISPEDFYQILMFIHLYPTHRQAFRVLHCGKTYLTTQLLPKMKIIASFLDEIS